MKKKEKKIEMDKYTFSPLLKFLKFFCTIYYTYTQHTHTHTHTPNPISHLSNLSYIDELNNPDININ